MPGDHDAAYTLEAYHLNDPRKKIRRRDRRLLIVDRLELLSRISTRMNGILDLADELRRLSPRQFRLLVPRIRELREEALRALADLKRHVAIPPDAPNRCRCDSTDHHCLPTTLAEQLLEIDERV